jgi:hypothetical protein
MTDIDDWFSSMVMVAKSGVESPKSGDRGRAVA